MNKLTRFELALIIAAISADPSLIAHETELATSSRFGSQTLCPDTLIKDRAPQENGGQVASAEPEKPVERELHGGERHAYEIHADAGLFLDAVVGQVGIDVVLTLYDPFGAKVASMDSPNGSLGLEQVSTITESTGTYRLEVAAGDKSVPAGRYRVTIDPLRVPRDEDRGRITAEQLNLSPILMCATNSAGGVMGKMVDAQSICIATAATNQVGNEGIIFRFVFWHSVALAAVVGVIVMLYAYVFPQFIPHGLTFVH